MTVYPSYPRPTRPTPASREARLIAALESSDGISTADLARATGMPLPSARVVLDRLLAQGRVKSKKLSYAVEWRLA